MPKRPKPGHPVDEHHPGIFADDALAVAIRQIKAAEAEQGHAADRIIGLVEQLLAAIPERSAQQRLEAILDACGFEDVAGQRLTKVRGLLNHLAVHLHVAVPAPEAMESPGKGLSQVEVDRLLRETQPPPQDRGE